MKLELRNGLLGLDILLKLEAQIDLKELTVVLKNCKD